MRRLQDLANRSKGFQAKACKDVHTGVQTTYVSASQMKDLAIQYLA